MQPLVKAAASLFFINYIAFSYRFLVLNNLTLLRNKAGLLPNNGRLLRKKGLLEQEFETFCTFSKVQHSGHSRFTNIVFHCKSTT
jgi:hypothetical protein